MLAERIGIVAIAATFTIVAAGAMWREHARPEFRWAAGVIVSGSQRALEPGHAQLVVRNSEPSDLFGDFVTVDYRGELPPDDCEGHELFATGYAVDGRLVATRLMRVNAGKYDGWCGHGPPTSATLER